MKNKLIMLTCIFCLLLSVSVAAQNIAPAENLKAVVETGKNDLKPAAPTPAPVSQTEKNMQPGAVGFQKSNTEEVKAIAINPESSKGLKPVNRDMPKTDTFMEGSQKPPVYIQQPNAEPAKVTAKPKVQKTE
ncbi:MAG: hypothetical protein ABIN74_09185 [Ferruginibacter sp.]